MNKTILPTTEEGNVMIAELIGWKFIPGDSLTTCDKHHYNLPDEKCYCYMRSDRIQKGEKWQLVSNLKFHSSYRWLMFVIERISRSYDVRIRWYEGDCIASIHKRNLEETEISDYGNYKPDILNIWLAVVMFAKWFKEHIKTKKS